MTYDSFANFSDSPSSPARSCEPITPSDESALDRLPKAIYIGTGGTIVLRCIDDGQDTTFVNVGSGAVLDVRPSFVRATGTTAGNLVGLM